MKSLFIHGFTLALASDQIGFFASQALALTCLSHLLEGLGVGGLGGVPFSVNQIDITHFRGLK